MIHLPILAEVTATTEIPDVQYVPIDQIWEQIAALSWQQAIMGLAFGIVCLMYGWRLFRIMVVICFGLIGIYIGMKVGAMAGNEIWGGVAGLILLGAISLPLMKWCVCLLGAAAGGILTAGLWYAFELPQVYIWAGGTVGVVAGGMISFIVLKASVMLFTSLSGSAITVVSGLALLHLYETQEPVTTHIQDLVHNQNWFLPVALMVPTMIGIVLQNKFLKHSQKWEL